MRNWFCLVSMVIGISFGVHGHERVVDQLATELTELYQVKNVDDATGHAYQDIQKGKIRLLTYLGARLIDRSIVSSAGQDLGFSYFYLPCEVPPSEFLEAYNYVVLDHLFEAHPHYPFRSLNKDVAGLRTWTKGIRKHRPCSISY